MVPNSVIRARFAAAIAIMVGLTLVPQAAAQAERVTTRDAAHDVVKISQQHPSGSEPDPSVAFGDLTALRVRYGPKRIFAAVHFRALNHRRKFGINFELQYKDAIQFRYPQVVIGVRRGHWQGHLAWNADNPDNTPCKVTHRINYRRDRIRLSFPVTCIDAPRWVAGRVSSVSKKSAGVFNADDLPDQNRRVATFGPRVHHG